MAEFQEDLIFKNISEEDIEILLKIADKKSKTKKIWTKELRQIDPSTYRPDLIIELDNENSIIEFQSTKANDNFSRRAHSYVAITDQKKKNRKEVNLYVISTVEESKIVSYYVNELNIFRYRVIGNDLFDGEKIINEIEEKYNQNLEITPKESIYLSLAPLMTKNGGLEKNIIKTINILITLNDVPPSTKNLCYGIEWLLVDKFVKDETLKNLLLDKLGDKMSAVYDYGERKEQKGIEKGIEKGINKIIINLYESGMKPEEIAEKTKQDIKQIEKIIN